MVDVRAYNTPPPDYQPPTYLCVVVMARGGQEERSLPLLPQEVDAYVGWKHRGGWQYVTTEQRPA